MNSADFWNGVAEKYAARPVPDEVAYADTLARTRSHLTGDESALEIGCGTGTTALKLAPYVKRLIATDIASKMIEIAEAKRGDVANVVFRTAAAEDEDPPEAPFDVVFAFNVFHLLEDPPAALATAVRRLRAGGLLISKTGLVGEAPVYIRPMISVMRLFGKAPAVRRLDQASLEAMVRDAGFEIVEAATYPGMAPARFLAARKRSV